MSVNQLHMLQALNRQQSYRTNHILHVIFCVLTFGFWIPIWLIVTISNANERQKAAIRIKNIMEAEAKGENFEKKWYQVWKY